MKANMLDSQLAILELPLDEEQALVFDEHAGFDEITAAVQARIK